MSKTTYARRWPYVVNAFVIFCITGMIYAWSIFVAPLEAEFGWLRAETSLTFTFCMVFMALGALGSGFITSRFGARATLVASACLVGAGFALASRNSSLIGLYVFYGVMVGFGVGLQYNALLSTVIRWFPDKGGIITGLLLMGFGFGGTIFGGFASWLLSVLNWRTTFLILGIGAAAILLIGTKLAVPPSPDTLLPPPNEKENVEKSRDFTAREMLKERPFWCFFFWALFLGAFGLSAIGHAAPIFTEIAADSAMDASRATSLSAVAVSVISFGGGIGRFITGFVWDRFGWRITLWSVSIANFLGVCLMLLSFYITAPMVFIVGGAFAAVSYGGVAPISSTLCRNFYGSKHHALNYGITNSSMIFSSFLGPGLTGTLQTATGGYLTSTWVFLGFWLVSAIGLLLLRKPE